MRRISTSTAGTQQAFNLYLFLGLQALSKGEFPLTGIHPLHLFIRPAKQVVRLGLPRP
jgi:hypothetical protein